MLSQSSRPKVKKSFKENGKLLHKHRKKKELGERIRVEEYLPGHWLLHFLLDRNWRVLLAAVFGPQDRWGKP